MGSEKAAKADGGEKSEEKNYRVYYTHGTGLAP